jgi:hypothetical protein
MSIIDGTHVYDNAVLSSVMCALTLYQCEWHVRCPLATQRGNTFSCTDGTFFDEQ